MGWSIDSWRTRSKSTWTRCATVTGLHVGRDGARRGGRRALGDSACVLPPPTLGGVILAVITRSDTGNRRCPGRRRPDQRPVAVGDEVYVIEANPRAIRTVPFVSKASGAPRQARLPIQLGATIRRVGAAAVPTDGHVSVKEAVLPFDRFPPRLAARPRCAPPARSWASRADFPTAFAKAQAAAGARPARERDGVHHRR